MAGDLIAEKMVVVTNDGGLHARPAAKLVQLTSKYPCDVVIAKDGQEVNGKSIMGVLMLIVPKGTTLVIKARGERAAEAVAAVVALVEAKFGESK
ncbi:MAG: HPr family phosphocarrier protein [Proteobacteria bacterium]|nr:HPr family phosphocarrier protein [Pseudomonadota bacterium]